MALFSHLLIAKALMFALEQDIDSVFININSNNGKYEINILVDQEYQALLEQFYIFFISHNRFQEIHTLEILSLDDAVALRLVGEEGSL